jgi:hypothetical protein
MHWQTEFAVFSPAALSYRRRKRSRTRNSNSPSSGQPENCGESPAKIFIDISHALAIDICPLLNKAIG